MKDDRQDLTRAKEEHEGLMEETKTCAICKWNQKCKWPHGERRDCCVLDIYRIHSDPDDSCGKWEPKPSCGTCKWGIGAPHFGIRVLCCRRDNPTEGTLPPTWGCIQWEGKSCQ